MITVARARTAVDLSPGDRARLREHFRDRHFLRLPGLIEPDLLGEIQRELDRAEFYERVHPGVGPELCMRRNGVHVTLELLLNDRALVDVIEEVTGCGAIGSFGGRVYRLAPGTGHHDGWHSDLADHRLVAMSVNLGRAPYQGGLLALRDAATRRVLEEVPNVGPGDALVFRLAPGLEHRVTELEGAAPKTAFAGWFHAQPDFASVLRRGLEPHPGEPAP